MDDMIYAAFVPTHSHMIGKKAEEIQKEFGIMIDKIDDHKEFRAFDRFRATGHYMKIRKFRQKYDLW